MGKRDEALFSQQRLDEVLWGREHRMYEEIDGMNEDALLNANVEDLCDYFEETYGIAVPRLKEEEITADRREARIDVSRDPLRAIHDRSRPVYVAGTGITFYVPFEGDAEMFRYRPSTYTTVFPTRSWRATNFDSPTNPPIRTLLRPDPSSTVTCPRSGDGWGSLMVTSLPSTPL